MIQIRSSNAEAARELERQGRDKPNMQLRTADGGTVANGQAKACQRPLESRQPRVGHLITASFVAVTPATVSSIPMYIPDATLWPWSSIPRHMIS